MTTPITKEQLQQIEAAAKEVLWPIVWTEKKARAHFNEKITPELVLELARIALAAMNAEPVYQVWDDGKWCDYEERLWRELYDEHSANTFRIVYTAPPAPVVNTDPVADVVAWHKEGEERTCDIRWRRFDVAPGPLFAVAQPVMKDHQIRELVNELRDIAVEYHGTQQLRERIAHTVRAAMLNHSENERDMDEPVSQSYKLPSQSSDAVNEAAWKLHDTLTEHGPLNGHQFNNLKGCFYEALKVAMCNSPAIPDAWIAVSERMPEMHTPVWCFGSIPEVSGKEFGFEGWLTMSGFVAENNSSSPGGCEKAIITHWMPLPAAPQQEGK